jgi:hypothetical protein
MQVGTRPGDMLRVISLLPVAPVIPQELQVLDNIYLLILSSQCLERCTHGQLKRDRCIEIQRIFQREPRILAFN